MSRSIIYFGIIVCVGAIALSGLYLMYELSPASTQAEGGEFIQVLIQRGDGFRDISEMLFEKHIIRSASAFRFFSLIAGKAHKFKPGSYDLSPTDSAVDIIGALVRGPEPDIEVLIREGETIYEIEDLLASRGIVPQRALSTFPLATLVTQYPFLQGAKSLEGFLFPDTYRFFFDSPVEKTIKIFLDNFNERALPVITRNTKDIIKAVTIASLIEKEVPDTDDRLLVSGIIARRVRIGMPLQIDASRDYARAHGDVRFDSYKYKGLPPGPISNPGLDAISASLHPKASPYLYYLSDPKTGVTYFSKTFEEHDDLRAKYINNGL